MRREALARPKPLPANLTLERPLCVHVCVHVFAEVRSVWVRLVAHSAEEHPANVGRRVEPRYVILEVGVLRERLPTLATPEWPLPCVYSEMHHKAGAAGEFLVANVAEGRGISDNFASCDDPSPTLGLHVISERRFIPEQCGTLVALEFASGLNALVGFLFGPLGDTGLSEEVDHLVLQLLSRLVLLRVLLFRLDMDLRRAILLVLLLFDHPTLQLI